MGNVPFIKEEVTSTNSRPTSLSKQIGEDNLSPDFKKKLHEWRIKKQQSVGGETKKIDWNLWKSGQIKLEGQGLIQLPDEKDLPEKFQKKLGNFYFKDNFGFLNQHVCRLCRIGRRGFKGFHFLRKN